MVLSVELTQGGHRSGVHQADYCAVCTWRHRDSVDRIRIWCLRSVIFETDGMIQHCSMVVAY